MSNPLAYFWRHPRRTGFILLNLVVLAAFVSWGSFTADVAGEGLGGLPSIVLGYTGMALLVIVWVAAWLAWGWMIATRQLRRQREDHRVA